ncbi:MAG TPA: hypothetical protein VF372_10505 [Thermodesulfobacteriota bacterium]
MAIQKRTLRGLQDIRTHSGKVERGNTPPYKLYMNLSCLEMEKFRRGKERESARKRMEMIDARFQEITAEEKEILQALNHPEDGHPSPLQGVESQPAPTPSAGGFKIRY